MCASAQPPRGISCTTWEQSWHRLLPQKLNKRDNGRTHSSCCRTIFRSCRWHAAVRMFLLVRIDCTPLVNFRPGNTLQKTAVQSEFQETLPRRKQLRCYLPLPQPIFAQIPAEPAACVSFPVVCCFSSAQHALHASPRIMKEKKRTISPSFHFLFSCPSLSSSSPLAFPSQPHIIQILMH